MTLGLFQMSLPKNGEIASGDAVVVRAEADVTLLAVVDALGHGHLAAPVAERAVEYLKNAPLHRDALAVTDGLHEALRGTRGAAAMCCLVRNGRVVGCGVGNVELRVVGARVPVVLTPGILGVSLRKPRQFEGPVPPGARLILFSDGISPRMDLERVERLPAEPACRWLVERYRRAHDDATILIADVPPVDFGASRG